MLITPYIAVVSRHNAICEVGLGDLLHTLLIMHHNAPPYTIHKQDHNKSHYEVLWMAYYTVSNILLYLLGY